MPASDIAHPKTERLLLLVLYVLIFVMFFSIVYASIIYLLPILGIIIPVFLAIAVALIVFAKVRLKFDLFSWLVWFMKAFFRPMKKNRSYEAATQHLVDIIDILLVKWVVSQLIWIVVVVFFRLDRVLGRFTFFFTFIPSIILLVVVTAWPMIKGRDKK
ncbi:MAG: hypothetical protein HY367_04150 [Candidatus Aenigmarchaeota archaeon]|nr:hypothetical protein [Candidatus Aenigmarchaeota archaeon]